MRQSLKAAPTAAILLLGGIVGFSLIPRAGAEDQPPPARSARGGLLAKADRQQFEVFFYPTGIRVFPQDASGKPLDVANASAIAIFYHPNSPSPWFDRPLRPSWTTAGEAPTSIDLAIDMATVPASGARVVFEVSGLADPAGSATSFALPIEFVATQVLAPSAAAAAANSRFIYASGFQGVGYYANPGPSTAPVASTSSRAAAPPRFSGNSTSTRSGGGSAARTVGPGARDWTTGRRGRLHKPWLSPID